jgi:hypothetical protein
MVFQASSSPCLSRSRLSISNEEYDTGKFGWITSTFSLLARLSNLDRMGWLMRSSNACLFVEIICSKGDCAANVCDALGEGGTTTGEVDLRSPDIVRLCDFVGFFMGDMLLEPS